MPKHIRTANRGLIPAPDDLRQRLAHPEWFHLQEVDGATNITVNVLRIPAPERSLVASQTAVASANRTVSIIFGQLLPGASKMHGALCMEMSVPSVQRMLYTSEDFLTELDKFAKRHDITPENRPPTGNLYPDERVVMERSSIAAIAFSEDETELRFYRTSAADMRLITQETAGKADLVHAVVDVQMGTAELVHLMHTLKNIVPREAK
jgi:hypothetical protein